MGNACRKDFSKTKEKIQTCGIPQIYKEKLIFDLERIEHSGVKGLRRIILFGSCARDQIRVGSDIDLLLVTDERLEQGIRGELASELAEERRGIPTDVVFYTEEEFQRAESLFVKQIKLEGRILWEA